MKRVVIRGGFYFSVAGLMFGGAAPSAQASWWWNHDEDRFTQMQDDNERDAVPINELKAKLGGPDGDAVRREREALIGKVTQKYRKAYAADQSDYLSLVALAEFYEAVGQDYNTYPYLKLVTEKDPKNRAAWNDLANLYGHYGPVALAFPAYEKAIALQPKESTYLYNLGSTIYLFREEAQKYYKFKNEQARFDYVLKLLEKSARLDPKNLEEQREVAMTYFNIDPFRSAGAVRAWERVRDLALESGNSWKISEAYFFLSKSYLNAGCPAEANRLMQFVTDPLLKKDREKVVDRIGKAMASHPSCEFEDRPPRYEVR